MPQTGLLIFLLASLLLLRPLIAVVYASAQMAMALLLAPRNRVRAFLGSYGEAKGSWSLNLGQLQLWIHPRLMLLPLSHVDFSAGERVPRGRQLLVLLSGPLALLLLAGIGAYWLRMGQDWGAMRFAVALMEVLIVLQLLRVMLARIDTHTWEDYGLVMGDGERLGLLLRHGKMAPPVQRVLWHWVRDDYQSVLAEVEPLLQAPNCDKELYEYAIYACLYLGKPEKGIELHQQMLERKPAEPTDLVVLSYLHEVAGETGKAIAAVQAALRKAPGFHLALNQRAHLALSPDTVDQCREDLDRCLRSDPEFGPAWVNRAWLHLHAGETEAAGKDLSRAFKLAPVNPLTYQAMGDYHLLKSEMNESQHWIELHEILIGGASKA